MTISLEDVCKAIAAESVVWMIDGVCCRDRNGTPWRKVRNGWYDEDNGRTCSDNFLVIQHNVQECQIKGKTNGRGYELLAEALKNGPCYKDVATVGALRMHLPEESRPFLSAEAVGPVLLWSVSGGSTPLHDSETSATLHAFLKWQKERKHG